MKEREQGREETRDYTKGSIRARKKGEEDKAREERCRDEDGLE